MNETKESLLRRCSINDTAVAIKSVDRAEIGRHIDEFLARGGAIRRFGVNERADLDMSAMYRNYPDTDMASCDHSLPYAAKFLGISQTTLKRMILAGRAPAHIVVQRGGQKYYRFRMADLRVCRAQREGGK